MIEAKKYLRVLKEYKLTTEQFNICYFIYLSKEDKSILKDLREYLEVTAKLFNQVRLLESLVDAGYLINDNRKGVYELKYFEVTEKFTKGLFVDSHEAFVQFVNIYPDFLIVNNKRVRAKTANMDELERFYFTDITKGGQRAIHMEVMAITDNYFTQKTPLNGERLAECGIAKFLESWEFNKHTYIPKMDKPVVLPQNRVF